MAHSSQPGALERLIVLTAASRKPPGPAADSEAARIRPRLLGPSERVLCDLRQALNGGWPQGRLRTTRETSPPSCPPRSEGSAKGGAASTAGTRPPTPTQRASRAPGLSRPPRSAVTSALRPPAPPRPPPRPRAPPFSGAPCSAAAAGSGSGAGGAGGAGGPLPSRGPGHAARPPARWGGRPRGRGAAGRAEGPGPRRARRAFQSQAAPGAAASAGGNSSAPTRPRIARNWVTLTRSSGHSLQPPTVICFLPDICPFRGGRAGRTPIFRRSRGAGAGRRVGERVGPAPPPRQAGHAIPAPATCCAPHPRQPHHRAGPRADQGAPPYPCSLVHLALCLRRPPVTPSRAPLPSLVEEGRVLRQADSRALCGPGPPRKPTRRFSCSPRHGPSQPWPHAGPGTLPGAATLPRPPGTSTPPRTYRM